jgi:YHS domain-containing protein
VAASASVARAADPAPTKAQCPVMPHKPAVAEHRAEYQGRTVHFCCEQCVEKFRQNPAAYLAVVDTASGLTSTPPESAKPGDVPGVAVAVVEFGERHLWVCVYLLAVSIGVALARRRGGRVERLGRLGTLALLVIVGVCVELGCEVGRARSEAAAAREAARKAAETPRPALPGSSAQLLTWSWPQGFHELPRGLTNTYYRGNDERSPKLFNGGNYRTATFTVSVRTADGREVRPGDYLAGQALRLRLDIVRAPKTTPHFFTPDRMARVYLHSALTGTEPTPVPLTTTRPEQEWAVEVPVGGAVPAAGYFRQPGLWCLALKPGAAPEIIHYYVRCVLHFQDGVVLPESCVWMVPVYESPILHGPRADGEWFSDRPIPEITGENTTDPDLLGIPKAERK